jgi:hypothetical protein
MATMTSYDQVGKAEDISDVISNIAPTYTPFQTMIGSRNVDNTLFQWQEDSLDPAAVNAQVEGAVAPAAAFAPTLMRNNYTQIFSKTAQVSGTTEAIKTYGRAKELAYQLAKKSKELKRDFEIALIGLGQVKAVGDNVSAARKFDAAQALVDASLKFHAADGSVGLTGAAFGAFNESVLTTANQALYIAGGEATVLMIKPADSLKMAGFAATGGRSRYLEADGKTVTNVVNVYVSPFGEQKVVINRFIRVTDSYLLDPTMWQKATLRPWFRKELAVTGDFTPIQLIGEYSLVHKNFKASAIIGDLS